MSYSDLSVWTFLMILAVLLISLLIGNVMRRFIPGVKKSLIPVSVLGGILLLVISTVVYYCTGDYFFNLPLFGNGESGKFSGMNILEIITYHCLGLGFIASAMRSSPKKFNKKRAGEIFNSGLVTVNGYLLQAFFGLAVTLIAACLVHTEGLISAAGILLAFGFGQGTGQALNYGNIYEKDHGFTGGGNFGLTIAALGFLVACIVGVIYINVMRRRGQIKIVEKEKGNTLSDYEDENEISVVSSMDKFTVQVAIVVAIYAASFGIMYGLSALIPSLANTLFGFNFFIGVLLTLPVKAILNKLYQKNVIKKQIVNNFMMDRIGGFAFDLMIVAGVAAIQIPLLVSYWGILLILAVVGALVTVFYVNFVCKRQFSAYRHEQFLAFFGMLTGTASTGMILLREIDGTYHTPASENLVYQNVPAMVFGFPLMFLATYAPKSDLSALITCIIVGVAFVALNLLLFRDRIFRRRQTAAASEEGGGEIAEPDGEPAESSAPEPTDGTEE